LDRENNACDPEADGDEHASHSILLSLKSDIFLN
jgi:hypothetical protein